MDQNALNAILAQAVQAAVANQIGQNQGAAAGNPAPAPVQQVALQRVLWGQNMVGQGGYLRIAEAFTAGDFAADVAGVALPEGALDAIANFSLTDEVIDRFQAFASVVAYQGFDPVVIRALLWNRFIAGLANGVNPVPANWLKEITMMIILFLQRGSALTKIMGRSSDQGTVIITALREKYNLQTGANNNAKNITLPRVAQSFPEIVATVIVRLPGLRTIGEPGLVPRGLMFSGAASLLPHGSRMIVPFLAWAKSQDQILNNRGRGAGQRDQGQRPALPAGRVNSKYYDYMLIAFNSTLVPQQDRVGWLGAITAERIENGSLVQDDDNDAQIINDYVTDEILQRSLNRLGEDCRHINWEAFGVEGLIPANLRGGDLQNAQAAGEDA